MKVLQRKSQLFYLFLLYLTLNTHTLLAESVNVSSAIEPGIDFEFHDQAAILNAILLSPEIPDTIKKALLDQHRANTSAETRKVGMTRVAAITRSSGVVIFKFS